MDLVYCRMNRPPLGRGLMERGGAIVAFFRHDRALFFFPVPGARSLFLAFGCFFRFLPILKCIKCVACMTIGAAGRGGRVESLPCS